MSIAGRVVVVEVKQFDPNREDADALARTIRGEVVAMGTTPGKRMRQAIQKAAPQLRERSRGELPTMLVVYNNVVNMRLHTDQYAVATAMNGLDVVPVTVPQDPGEESEFGDVRSGPQRMMTDRHNTTISAVAVLARGRDGVPRLCVYHSRHARHPIDTDWLRFPEVEQWRRPDGAGSSLAPWEPA